jgi:5'-nucleotidase
MSQKQDSRRSFIKKIGAASLVAAASPWALPKVFAHNEFTKITLLHTNDWHSRMEPFPMDGSRLQGLGGAAKRAALIKQIRAKESNVILLDAGDIFQGTPYFNFFEGELEYKVMSEMAYDVATFGNHDFDLGLNGLERVWHHKSFDFVNVNYDLSDTFLHNQVQPYRIIEKDGIRIGIIGVSIDLEDLIPPKNRKGLRYLDPIKPATDTAKRLRADHRCDVIVCLSHLGYQYEGSKVSDVVLAQQSTDIDIIIGGHTHTFMEGPDVRKNAAGKTVHIHQVGWAGILLGRIDLYFDKNKKSAPQISATALPIGQFA